MKIHLVILTGLLSLPTTAATLELTEGVQLLAINGQQVASHSPTTFNLKSGPQTMSVRYNSLVEYGVEDHEFIHSDVQVLKFNAKHNQSYRIQVPEMDIEQARSFAQQPHFNLFSSDKAVEFKQWNHSQLVTEWLGSN